MAELLLKNESCWQQLVHFRNYVKNRTVAVNLMREWLRQNGYGPYSLTEIREAMARAF